jgi:pimeloyl-ACP methyl ester carboxylesterase
MRTYWQSAVTGTLDQANRAIAKRSRPATATGTPGRGPVVLIGGLATTDSGLAPMARWMRDLGHDVTTWSVGNGMACARRSVDALADHVTEVADTAGEPVRLVGHSRGGQFARAVGMRQPDDVAALVTLGSPFDVLGVRLPMLWMATGLACAGTLGVPGVFSMGCLVGACCRAFRDAMRAPWPADIPFTSIYSRTDEAVPWRSSHDPYARQVEVPGSHLGLLSSRTARRAVADALVRVPDRAPERAAAVA